jgi:hypothetical protein
MNFALWSMGAGWIQLFQSRRNVKHSEPRVGRSGQPWADLHIPFGEQKQIPLMGLVSLTLFKPEIQFYRGIALIPPKDPGFPPN